MMFHKIFDKFPTKTLRYIADDFRKAGAIAGVGLVGFVLSTDNITEFEALVLLTVGIIFWVFGLLLDYVADIMDTKTNKPEHTRQHR